MTDLLKTHVLAVLVALLPILAHGKDDMAELRPKIVLEHLGSFCHTGIVTRFFANGRFILKERDGRFHHISKNKFQVHEGDLIAVEGECGRYENGMWKRACRIVHLGESPLPPPEAVPLTKLLRKDFLYRRVATEGTLIFVQRDEIDTTCIRLLVKDGTTILNAALNAGANQPTDIFSLLGARLRLTGVLMPPAGARRIWGNHLYLNPADGFKVLRPPPADLFNAPEVSFNTPRTPDEIVRMDSRRFEGTVLATWGGDQMMLEGKNFHRAKATLARPEELPAAGEHVAVIGFPDSDLYGINLVYARCKHLSEKKDMEAEPKPVDITLRQLLMDNHGRPRINGYSHGRLLRIRGTVLDVQPSLELFSLNDDGLTMPVDCSSSPDAIQRLEANSRIEAVILAVVETDRWRESIALPQTRGLKLILRSPNDMRILSRPPWWTPTRLTVLIISLLVAIILIIAANRVINRIMMRRKVAERTRLAVELHDSLSQTLAGVACQIAAGHDAVADDPEAAKNLLATAERMLESSRTELKNCLFDLRNDTVDDPDFERAIRRTLTGLKPEADISIRFRVARSLMTDSAAHAVLCIIRELAANAIRHGAATRIRVAGTVDDGHLRFSVIDDGCGFDTNHHPGPREGHFGLAGIRERLANLGGELALSSTHGTGTKVTVKLKTDNG